MTDRVPPMVVTQAVEAFIHTLEAASSVLSDFFSEHHETEQSPNMRFGLGGKS